jgi:hypothetical protein
MVWPCRIGEGIFRGPLKPEEAPADKAEEDREEELLEERIATR